MSSEAEATGRPSKKQLDRALLRRILGLFKPHMKLVWMTGFAVLVGVLVGLLPPFFLREIVDHGFQQNRLDVIAEYSLFTVLAVIAGAGFTLLYGYWGVVVGQRIKLDFSVVDKELFETRRVAYQTERQESFFRAYQIDEVVEHTVRSGESLWLLAAREYEVPVWLLRQYNPDVNLDRVRPGAVIRFPRLKSIQTDDA